MVVLVSVSGSMNSSAGKAPFTYIRRFGGLGLQGPAFAACANKIGDRAPTISGPRLPGAPVKPAGPQYYVFVCAFVGSRSAAGGQSGWQASLLLLKFV